MSKLNFNGHAGRATSSRCRASARAPRPRTSNSNRGAAKSAQTETHTPVGVEGCDKVPFAPRRRSSPETAQSDAPDGATTVVQVPQNVARKRNQHVRHQGCARHAARRPDAEPVGRARPGSLLGRADRDRLDQRRRAARRARRSAPSRSKRTCRRDRSSGDVYLGSPGGGPITDPPYTIYPRRREPENATASRCACRARSRRTRSTGRLEVTFAEQPAAAVQRTDADAQRRRTRAAGQPAGVRERDDRLRVHAVSPAAPRRSARRRSRPPAAPRRCPSRSARARPTARRKPARTPTTRSTSRARDGQQYLARSRRRCPRAGRRDPVGAAVRRTAGAAGHLPGSQPDRHGDRRRRLGRTVPVQRPRLPDRPLQRGARTGCRFPSRQRPVRSTSARSSRACRSTSTRTARA